MDVSDPTRAVTPTLDGPVLAALAAAGRPMTVADVAAQTARGSEIGVRRCLARLSAQGLVRSISIGRSQVHELNREHIAAPVADLLASLRLELWARLRGSIAAWEVRPLVATVFGSAARGDGDELSDIDLLLVHPLLPGESLAAPGQASIVGVAAQVVGALATQKQGTVDPVTWDEQLDELRELVQRWTGNSLQLVDLAAHDYVSPSLTVRRLIDEVRRDGIELLSPSALEPGSGRRGGRRA